MLKSGEMNLIPKLLLHLFPFWDKESTWLLTWKLLLGTYFCVHLYGAWHNRDCFKVFFMWCNNYLPGILGKYPYLWDKDIFQWWNHPAPMLSDISVFLHWLLWLINTNFWAKKTPKDLIGLKFNLWWQIFSWAL